MGGDPLSYGNKSHWITHSNPNFKHKWFNLPSKKINSTELREIIPKTRLSAQMKLISGTSFTYIILALC